MLINRDPDGRAGHTPEMIALAKELGVRPVNVICVDESGEECMTFFAWADFMPRIGEEIISEDRKCFRVTGVRHSVTHLEEGGKTIAFGMLANVFAVQTKQPNA
jgi:hypothetical protein